MNSDSIDSLKERNRVVKMIWLSLMDGNYRKMLSMNAKIPRLVEGSGIGGFEIRLGV